jgi:tetratricopeptide (TPR) repeat protein
LNRLTRGLLAVFFAAGLFPLEADPAFLKNASALLDAGKTDEADALAQAVLAASPNDADALVVAGTVRLYKNTGPARDDSIYHLSADPAGPEVFRLSPEGAESVAQLWKLVPALDPTRGYLWGDLAQMAFRAGDPTRALEYALQALTVTDPEALRTAASVFALNLDWEHAAQALALIPGNRTALLYRGLNQWRTSQDGWRAALKAFADDPGPDAAGAKLAGYLLGPEMRDTETGFLEALKQESGVASLAVLQKYVDRYPDQFLARLQLGQTLSEYGSFAKALEQYAEIDRLGLAATPEEQQSVLFQQAWAFQASGRREKADQSWEMLTDSKNFYLRSAADWFLGESALGRGKASEAKDWWAKTAGEPARSKYAWWADQELKKLN